jgi:hypothetical protein
MFPSSRSIIRYTLPIHKHYSASSVLWRNPTTQCLQSSLLIRLVTSYCLCRAIEFSHVYVLYYCLSCRALGLRETFTILALTNSKILTSTPRKVSSFPTSISELDHFNLTAYGLIAGLPTLNYLRHLNSSRLTLWLFARHYHAGFPPALQVRTSWRTQVSHTVVGLEETHLIITILIHLILLLS